MPKEIKLKKQKAARGRYYALRWTDEEFNRLAEIADEIGFDVAPLVVKGAMDICTKIENADDDVVAWIKSVREIKGAKPPKSKAQVRRS